MTLQVIKPYQTARQLSMRHLFVELDQAADVDWWRQRLTACDIDHAVALSTGRYLIFADVSTPRVVNNWSGGWQAGRKRGRRSE